MSDEYKLVTCDWCEKEIPQRQAVLSSYQPKAAAQEGIEVPLGTLLLCRECHALDHANFVALWLGLG